MSALALLLALAPLATAPRAQAGDAEAEARARVERFAAPAAEEVAVAVDSGLAHLLASQNPDGSWGGTTNATFTSGFANVETYRMWQIGTTGLALRAVLEEGRGAEADAAVDRAIEHLIANADPRRPADWDVDNNWAIIYALDAVSRALQHPRFADHPRTPALREAGASLLAALRRYQSPRGGWGYYSSAGTGWQPEWCTSFMTAVAVLSMLEARAAGLEVEEKMFDAAVRALECTRLPNGAYDYGLSPTPRHLRLESINQVQGSLGRIQVGNLALHRAGSDVTLEDIEWGLEQFVKHHKFLRIARNTPVPHEAYYGNAAYFYLFGHYYAAQAAALLPAEKRARFEPFVQWGILLARQEDGSMWDFWIAKNTRAYGTAFGVMGLTAGEEVPSPAPAGE